MAGRLTPCGALLRDGDPDRYLTVLAGGGAQAEALFALYAFNLELARTAELVREALLGEIRLQWWRDALAPGAPSRPHPVVDALRPLVDAGRLPREALLALVDARARDLDKTPPADHAAFLAYCDATAGALNALAVALLGGDEAEQAAARQIGMAWAMLGLLRATPHLAQQGRILLPEALLTAAGTTPRALLDLRPSPALAEVARHLDREAERLLSAAQQALPRPRRAIVAPFLLARLAPSYRRLLARVGYDLFDPLLAARPPGLAWKLALAGLGRR